MDEQEYLKLLEMKRRAAAEHRQRKLQFRARIAAVVLERPEWAFERAKEFLNKPAQPWQRWSRTKWRVTSNWWRVNKEPALTWVKFDLNKNYECNRRNC